MSDTTLADCKPNVLAQLRAAGHTINTVDDALEALKQDMDISDRLARVALFGAPESGVDV